MREAPPWQTEAYSHRSLFESMTELLARGTVVLDGGLSNALEDRGHDLSSALWTARLLRDDPGEIVAVHRAYFAAGSRVATTASYQSSVAGLLAASVGPYGAARADGSEYTGR